MSSTTKCSIQLQINPCISTGCDSTSEVICRHCHEQYCYLCFMCHRKSLLDDMQSISEQMSLNRRQGVSEVIEFINKQSKDAHDQAKKLVNDVIDRIIKASQNINTYIENRRLVKLNRLEECLQTFDKDAELLNSKLSRQVFLPADTLLELRRKYAYNMFNISSSSSGTKDTLVDNEEFFENYRYFDELINLRQNWTFLQAALTTVYFPGKKDFSLDKILTFLEYRHDRVLENYRDYLSINDESKEVSSKSIEDLLNELSFLSKKDVLPTETENFSYISETLNDSDLIKVDSGHFDDETCSNSSHSWQIEYNDKIDDSIKNFEQDYQPFWLNKHLESS
ncbi:unnamed protein product [Adineta steineri]|uniref:Uncharacterized protein n=1 Tax=Adineta steineri TaxID=433720 RepID=A0A816CTB8_9BILA|nr:unnamed protein product [Adineta steineri]CAF1627472.1 unnamed protein product [Adineta steineri]